MNVRVLIPLLACVIVAACTGGEPASSPASPDAPAASSAPPDAASASEADAAPAPAHGRPVRLTESFLSAMTPEDNIDSVASWTTAEGDTWVFATAKSTHRLLVYDGDTGRTLRTVGRQGSAAGEFARPNGVFVADDLLWVVERDNRRVQAFALPGLEPLGHFGAEVLRKPYGLWLHPAAGGGWNLYVTDAYELEDGSVPPLAELDRRVHRFHASLAEGRILARHQGAFGDVGEQGALRVVESIFGDPANDRLLIAEEDESWANEFKVYDLGGRFAGRTVGAGLLAAQAEGIALRACPGDAGGWWLTTEQDKEGTVFHLFERVGKAHAGSFRGATVANTDGIWLQQAPTRAFPEGVLYAVHDDQGMVAFDWRAIAAALALPGCPD